MTNLSQIRKRLRGRYLESLRGKKLVLDDMYVDLHEDEIRDAIQRVAHQLHGSGGGFGYPRLSQAAKHVEFSHPERLKEPLDTLLLVIDEILKAEEGPLVTNILVVEDDECTLELLVSVLEDGGRSTEGVSTLADARVAINTNRFDLIVLDLALPDGDGRALMSELQDVPILLRPEIIVLSALGRGRAYQECVALGAARVLTKPLDFTAFTVEIAATISRIHEAAAASLYDPLTGLFNRAGLSRGWTRLLAFRAPKAPIAVAFLDIDGFKKINDDLGHETGDEALKRLANTLAMGFPRVDQAMIGRWGGDEFVVASIGLDYQAMHDDLASLLLPLAGEDPPLTASLGVIEVHEAMPLDQVLSAADSLMYKEKNTKRVTTPQLQPIDVLLVEDNPIDVTLVTTLLHDAELSTEHVTTVATAIKELEGWPYRLVLLDRHLEHEDGLALLQRIRDRGLEIPICLLTVDAKIEGIEDAFTLGADEYIVKPFEDREFIARLNRLLGRARVEGYRLEPLVTS